MEGKQQIRKPESTDQIQVQDDELQAHVVLVDMEDQILGCMEKMQAHAEGRLHRAFSVFLYKDDAILLQRRAKEKYHCGGLWTNTCCSHPGMGESVYQAACRRLQEELGIETENLDEIQSFVYRYTFENGLTEFEYDHILIGEYRGGWIENPEEVEEVRWVKIKDLIADIQKNPEHYTPWFMIALKKVLEFINARIQEGCLCSAQT